MLSSALLTAARSSRARGLITAVPATRKVVERFVAGEVTEDGVRAVEELVGSGLHVTLDRLGEDTLDRAAAEATRDGYLALIETLADRGLASGNEVSVKLSACGQALGADGEKIARENARAIAEAAKAAGMLMTLDMEDHTTIDSTLGILRELREDFPWLGAVLQSALYRTEDDCRALAHEGSRIRLVKGAYKEPDTVAHQAKSEVDKAYVRCLRILMAGRGRPMVGSHDLRMIRIAESLARENGRSADSYEFQMLYGIRAFEQRRLAESGATVRVYVPYGDDWYGYFMRRLAERPANLAFFARSLLSR
ncbi:proline dehydrogenase [Mangrovactinospora gilvigrisea]|uniref:proline dehydrogenase n=1 Tax=Mangrovactinospora gilvigrisea TaxID=1428644 RepID=A0A1J7CBZ6_9ACTN|nr:proline dehydrogenase family protein [Mangrovactinospora gilvigrisea]OIV37186.1 proline dehydrogenase [Mangrovactinospora gilvigrisea]